jgi:ketosteroid isomerase-like protein
MRLFTDDALHCVVAHVVGGTATKAETTQRNIEALQTVRGRMKFTIHSITAQDDRVVVEAENISNIIDGTVYDNFYVFIFYIRGGAIYRMNEYLDTLYLSKLYERLSDHPAIAPRLGKAGAPDPAFTPASDPYFQKPLAAF